MVESAMGGVRRSTLMSSPEPALPFGHFTVKGAALMTRPIVPSRTYPDVPFQVEFLLQRTSMFGLMWVQSVTSRSRISNIWSVTVAQIKKFKKSIYFRILLLGGPSSLVLGTFSNFVAERVANSSSCLRLIGD